MWSYLLLTLFWSQGDCDVTNWCQILNFFIFRLYHCIPRVKISASVKFQLFISIISEVICFWPFFGPGDCDVTSGVKFWNFWNFDFILAFLVSKLVQMPNFNFLFQLFVKLFAFDPFLVQGDCDVTNGVKFWIFLYLDFITAFLVSKLVQVSNFNFVFQLFVKLFAFDPFLVQGDCDVTNGVKFWIFWYLGFITELLVSKLVQLSNFNFLFQLFLKLFAFDPFLVPGGCDVINVVKFWNFWNFDFITAFLFSKLVQMPNFNFLFQLFVKLFAFEPFLVPGDCDVTNVVKFWIFCYLGFITEFLVSKLVQVSNFNFLFQLFVKLFAFDPFLVPGDCDATNGVKFGSFCNFDLITAFLLSKLVQMPNFNFIFQLFVKLIGFDPFLVPGVCDVTNGVKFWIFYI